jgi:RNA polymerase sigma-70 factor (ECF subfamily)
VQRDLIERAKRDEAQLEPLIVAVWPEAYRIAFSVLRDAGLAEDAAQDACAAIAGALPELKHTDRFRAWAYRIISNSAMSAARRRPRVEPLDALRDRATENDTTARIDLAAALVALPLPQRAAIVLHYYAGLSSAEIAAACDLPASTVRFNLMLGRRALLRALCPAEALPNVN